MKVKKLVLLSQFTVFTKFVEFLCFVFPVKHVCITIPSKVYGKLLGWYTQLQHKQNTALTASVCDAAERFMSVVPCRIQSAPLPLRRDRWIIWKGGMGDPIWEAPVEKRKKWQSEEAFAPLGLWSSSSSRQWCTHIQRQADCLSFSTFSQPLSVIFLFHLLHIPSSLPMVRSRDPPVPTVLTTRLLSRLWYLLTERSTVCFECISPATMALITATKLKLFNGTDSHLFVIHSHYHFPKAPKRMKKKKQRLCGFFK